MGDVLYAKREGSASGKTNGVPGGHTVELLILYHCFEDVLLVHNFASLAPFKHYSTLFSPLPHTFLFPLISCPHYNYVWSGNYNVLHNLQSQTCICVNCIAHSNMSNHVIIK